LLRRGARNRRKAVSAFSGVILNTYAYVDGFNLYYRALKRTPHKWLNLDSFLTTVYPGNRFTLIRYFTAKVKPHPGDPDQRIRQDIYLRALQTLDNVRIHFGHFTSHQVNLPLAASKPGKAKFAKVIKSEEKGSDVNLAAHLVNDAHLGVFDLAIVVTNDSDLVEPIRIVTQQVGLPVGVLNPCDQPAGGLKKAATHYRVLRKSVLRKSQFSQSLTDNKGSFSKPRTW
jgi:hypothetical protein